MGFTYMRLGDVRVPDGAGTGGHFMASGDIIIGGGAETMHSFTFSVDRHRGDLGNLRANQSGSTTYYETDAIPKF